MVARLLRDKGVVEYVEAARIVARSFPPCQFSAARPFRQQPDGDFRREEIDGWVREGILDYLARQWTCGPFSRPSNVSSCLPITVKEFRGGILEALATGRPVIRRICGLPGHRAAGNQRDGREAARPSQRSPTAMAAFAQDPGLAEKMGKPGRERARGNQV